MPSSSRCCCLECGGEEEDDCKPSTTIMLETDELGSCWNERPPFMHQTTVSEEMFFIESFLEPNLENLKCVRVDSSTNVRLACEMASQTPTLVENNALSTLLDSDSSLDSSSGSTLNTKCGLCNETYTTPKVLPCFHTFCQPCLEKSLETSSDKLECPQCHQDCALSSQGVAGLLSDYAISNILESSASVDGASLHCTACKSKESNATARCFDCANFLCSNCVMAHQFMHCFEGHRVMTLCELQNSSKEDLKVEKPVSCLRHKNELLRYFCRSCNAPICKECTVLDHPKGLHDYDYLTDVAGKQLGLVSQLIDESKLKTSDLRNSLKNVEHTSTRLQVQYHKAQNEINETFQFYRSVLEERKQEALKELDGVYNSKQVSLSVLCQKVQDSIDKIYQTCDFMERLLKYASTTEVLLFKKLLDAKIQAILNYNPDLNLQNAYDIEFVSNYQAIQVGVRNTFGYIRSNTEVQANKPQPIARPNGGCGGNNGGNGGGSGNGGGGVTMNGGVVVPPPPPVTPNGIIDRPYQNGHLSSFESNILSKRFSSANNLGPFSTTLTDLGPYEKWSSGGGDNGSLFQNGGDHFHHLAGDTAAIMDLSSKLITSLGGGGGGGGGAPPGGGSPASGGGAFPPKSQIKRQKMIYHCKFGEFGVMEGQFTEPSGVAVNAQNDIIVADTNNHRIQIFDKEGRFKFQFGECGKRDGQLLYPNRVAAVKTSGDIIVTERSPTHQIQIYNQYGQFVRKFGANILQHPRGVTVDHKGRVVVVECKVMRVIIFDQMGAVLQKFGCSKHLEFPNGVVVNDKQEIFISDNRAHCVKVFNYEGAYLRQIGGEGITNYPIGVGINQAGEILIADNHNNFNLTIFTQDGTLVNALESKVKHAQCFDVALMDDGSVVLASKDYRLYIYRYLQVPSVGL